jgi:hypothetical protein
MEGRADIMAERKKETNKRGNKNKGSGTIYTAHSIAGYSINYVDIIFILFY